MSQFGPILRNARIACISGRNRHPARLLGRTTAGLLAGLSVLLISGVSSVQAEPSRLSDYQQLYATFDSLGAQTSKAAASRSGSTQIAQNDDSLLGGDDDSLLGGDDDSLLGGDEGGDSLLGGDDGGDSLLGGDDDLLGGDEPSDGGDLLFGDSEETGDGEASETAEDEGGEGSAAEEHAALFAESRYPSANTCATCHPKHYREWSVSQHAYAQMSPIYMAMQITINSLTSSTNGDFCIRCHNQVGMNMEESIFISNLDRHPTSREGITCVVCHRVNENYGKASGRLALQEGDIYSPVYGPTGDEELERVLNNPGEYQVSADRDKPGRAIHAEAQKFFALSEPAFCGTCHDVTLLNGFRLEEAFTEYKMSEAADQGVTCQDCHMGKIQGVDSGYEMGPAANVGGALTQPRKLTNHFFAGPDYPIIHPGLFPHNTEAAELASLREWLKFDYKAGWGTDEFEDNVPADYDFPEPWQWIDARYDAREILEEQFDRMEWAKGKRLEVLQAGFELSDIRVTEAGSGGLDFEIDVINPMNGHSVPTGFDAERLLFLDVTVTNPAGEVVYRSGDRDPNGDVRDAHSLYVHNGELPLDDDLFNLQSKFIVRPVRGAEREQVLAVNTSVSALPFVRPETRATTIYGRPRGARKHKKTIEPYGKRTADYSVDGDQMTAPGEYQISIKLVSQMVPVNLIHAIQNVGFDYNMSPRQIADRVVEGAITVWEKETSVVVGEQQSADAGDRAGD